MGADLIVATLTIDAKREPDFGAGRAYLTSVADEEIRQAYDAAQGDAPLNEYDEHLVNDDGEWLPEAYAKARQYFREQINELELILVGDTFVRDMNSIYVRGAWVYLTGGMSWGDDPTDSFRIINDLGYFGGLLQAMGFEFETGPWPEPVVEPVPDDEVELVQVVYNVPVVAVVNVKTNQLERVVEVIEHIEPDLNEPVVTNTDLKPVSQAIAERAKAIADDQDWPAWEAGF